MSERMVKPQPVRLVPLLCARCKAPIPAQPDEVAWCCEQCGQGLIIDPAPAPGLGECGTRSLDIFFSEAVPSGSKGRPFWVCLGQVSLTVRDTYKGDQGRAAREFWAQPRLFFIPAWETTLEETVRLGVALLRQPQRMVPGGRSPFLPVVTPPIDVRPLAEFMIVSIEADRSDYLKTVNFDLKLEQPQLWILP